MIATLLHDDWRARVVAAILSGVALAVAFPDTSIQAAGFLALGPLIAAAAVSPNAWQAFLTGWISLSVTWLINVPWVITVMSDQGGIPLPLGIGIFVTMSLYLGLFGGLFALIVYRLAPGKSWWPWIAVAIAWAVVEYARTILLTGFPWNLLASTLVDLPFVQIGSWTGPYVLGGMTVVPAVVLARMAIAEPVLTRRVAAIAGVGVYLIAWGVVGIAVQDENPNTGVDTRKIAIIQPNIEQGMRWDATQAINLMFLMQEMSLEALDKGAEVIIWPESTVPLRFVETEVYRAWVEKLSRNENVDLILGSVATDPRDETRIWNSAFLVSDGEIQGRYDKIRLVPFGEYVPLRRALFFAEKLVRTVGTFTFGELEDPLIGKSKYGIGICYEIVYPSIGAERVRRGSEVLVTITNDAWYGQSSAARQHLDSARLRAIESRRWLVRAATTGISAIVDTNGRLVDSIAMDRKGIIMAEVPMRTDLTPYVRFGDWFPPLGAMLLIVTLFFRGSNQRKDFEYGRSLDSAN